MRLAGRRSRTPTNAFRSLACRYRRHCTGPRSAPGRWLQPGDTHAIVLNEKLAKDAGVQRRRHRDPKARRQG